MRISAVVNISGEGQNLERSLKTIEGWIDEIIVQVASSTEINIALIKKYKIKIIHCKAEERNILEKGIKASGGDWVLTLNSEEEVSIPLKREILSKLPGVLKSCVSVPLVNNELDEWKIESRSEVRLFRRTNKRKGQECETFVNPIRHYIEYPAPGAPIAGRQEIKKILVIKIRGIGDTVLMTPLLRTLKGYYNKAQITCVVKPESAAVLAENRDVDRVIVFRKFMRTLLDIKSSGKYDLALCPQASQKTAFLSLASGAPLRVINNHNGKNYFTTIRVKKPEEYEDAVDRDLDCARSLGLPVTTKEVRVYPGNAKNTKRKGAKNSSKDTVVGISVSASKVNKMWGKERYAELADRLISEKGFKVVFFDDPARPEILREVLRLMENKPFRVNEKKLSRVIKMIAGLDVFVGNDSGLAHIAAGLAVPSVTIIGPDEPKIFHPYKKRDKHFIVSCEMDCKPCWKDSCAQPLCLEKIKVSEVLNAVKKAVLK